MKQLFAFFIAQIICTLMVAQPVCQVQEYNVSMGLAQSIVTGVIQDKKGVIWISTWNGLNKFDGYTFKNYKASTQKNYSLTHNRIIHMNETAGGNILCKSYDGRIYIFDCNKEVFIDILKPIESEIRREIFVDRVYSLKKGIAWLTTNEGYCFRIDENELNKNDGIQTYSTFNGELKSDKIYNIYQDSWQDEWILTDRGITIIGNKKIDNDLPFKLIHEFKEEIYLVSTSNKLAIYHQDKGTIKIMDIPYPITQVNTMASVRNQLALGTDNGIILYNPEQNTFEQIDIHTPQQSCNNVSFIYEDKLGECWAFSTSPGVTRIDISSGEKHHLATPEDKVVNYGRDSRSHVIFEDKQGTLWTLPTKGNFSYYDRKSKELKTFYTDPNNSHSGFTPLIRYCSIDKQGNAWIISSRGVKKMTFFPETFHLNQPDEKGMETRAFLLDNKNRFWIASKSGYIRLYYSDGSLIGHLSPEGKITNQVSQFNHSIYCIHQGQDGRIYLGSKNHGLFELTEKSDNQFAMRNYTHQSHDKYSLGGNDVYAIHTDHRNNLWIGSYNGGLNLMQRNANGDAIFINYMNELRNYPIERFLNVRTIAEVGDSVLLVGTTSGLISFNSCFQRPEEIKFYKNRHNVDNEKGLLGSDVMHVFTDSRNETYVMTFTGGINKVISNNLLSDSIVFKSYTTRQGLASDLVLSMIEDENKKLWVVTENALSRFDSANDTFDNYDRAVLHKDFNFTEAIPAYNASKQLVFGTDMGFLTTTPELMKKSDYVPPILLTELKIHGKQADTAIDDMEQLELTPQQRNITINYAALDYTKPENILYAYRLKGLEQEWNYAEKSRAASYINLPPGEFALEVKSTNSDGVWVDNVRTLPIHVLPTFWETAWAWLLYFVAFVLFTGCIVYVLFYIYRLRHRVDVEQQLASIKLKFFTDISHELRTPLTLIASPVSEVLEGEVLSPTARQHLTVVQKNTDRMLRLINQILDFRKIQNQKMKLMVEETELISFLMRITENFRSIAEEKQIELNIESEVEELYLWIDKDKVEKIIFNLLSNAFKYTPSRKSITLCVRPEADNVTVTVIDKGSGISADKLSKLFDRFETDNKSNLLHPSSGIGLSLVKEFAEMHHGRVEVKSQIGVGSEFCVTLPLHREILEQDEQVELILTDVSNTSTSKIEQQLIQLEDETESEDIDRQSVLIVEDNHELRNLLRMILIRKYHVLEASNGEEGLQLACEAIPDMIVSDVMMPVMDGLEMIGKVKENKDICHIPVILLSAKSSLDDRIHALEYGIDDYITKPFSSTYLKARIAALFAVRKKLQETLIDRLAHGNATRIEPIATATEATISLEPTRPDIIPHDKQFIAQIMEYMEQEMDNPDLSIDTFAEQLGMSRSIFYKKLKSITGLAPIDFIREIRIKRAMQLIEGEAYNFSQIAYMVGFSDPKYFSRCFKKYAGVSPSEYKGAYRKEEVI